MELLFRQFWVVFVVVTCVNGRMWWSRVQRQIQSQPELEPGYRRLYRGYLVWMNVPWLAMGLGILTGEVPSMFDYLQPSGGNAFVQFWWGLMAALLGLGTWWIFLGGGAETLERHPGVYMVPDWPASRLRLYWLGMLTWNVAIGAFLFLGFPGRPHGTPAPTSPPDWLAALFPVFFVGMWLLVCTLLSAMGGWGALAKHYAAQAPFSRRRFRLRSGQLGGFVNYGGSLTLGADAQGLHLAVMPLFRVGHPPLWIPWSDMSVRKARSWLFEAVELEFAKAPNATLRISRRLAKEIFDASGRSIPVQPAA